MTPYYEDDAVTIYHGDCLDVLPIECGVVVTDPPYGISDAPLRGLHARRAGAGDNTWHPPSDWDHSIDPAWCDLVCASAGVVAWFGHWRKRYEVESAMRWPIRAEIVWAKDVHCGPPCPVARRDERIWLFSRDGVRGRVFDTSVWDESVIPTWSHKNHKNEKPLNLMLRLVRFLSDEGDTVLDPFMGSGTTLRAAKDLGRKAIGIEIEERYCEIAARRMSQEVLPL